MYKTVEEELVEYVFGFPKGMLAAPFMKNEDLDLRPPGIGRYPPSPLFLKFFKHSNPHAIASLFLTRLPEGLRAPQPGRDPGVCFAPHGLSRRFRPEPETGR